MLKRSREQKNRMQLESIEIVGNQSKLFHFRKLTSYALKLGILSFKILIKEYFHFFNQRIFSHKKNLRKKSTYFFWSI